MNKISQKRKAAIIAMIILIVATVTVIFGNSLKNQEESGEQSREIVDIIKPIIDSDDSIPEDKFEFGLRKFAHVFEFTVLSFELMTLYFILNKKAPPLAHIPLILAFVMTTALTDETVQLFSQRGSSVVDVWIDFSGGILGILLFEAMFFCHILLVKIRKKKALNS